MSIELLNVSKSFSTSKGEVSIFKNLNLKISSGEFVSIIGPNGCGKSTLFNMIIGLDKDYSGKIIISDVYKINSAFGYMMQKDLLLPWKTVYQNIITGVEIQKRFTSQVKDEVLEYLNKFSISNLKDTYPLKLSEGEKQKVALIRTLILNTDILLLDEPFSSIDFNTRIELQMQVYSLAKEKGKTVLLITHDIDEAIAVSDRIIVLNPKPNGILKEFPVKFEIVNRNPLNVKKLAAFSSYFSEIWSILPK